MAIYLLRHAQSDGNADAVFQGRLDYGLTELGRRQARLAGRWLAARGAAFGALISSPLKRARQTAQILAAELGLGEPRLDARIQEYDGGELQGLHSDQIDARWPDYKDRPLEARGDFSRFGGESYAQMQARLAEFTAACHAEFGAEDEVLVVCHGGTLYQLLKLWCGWPAPRHFFNHIGNCCCFCLELREVAGHACGELQWMLPLEMMGELPGDGGANEMERGVQQG